MRKILTALAILMIAGLTQAAVTKTAPSGKTGCLACHEGIEDIRDDASVMMLQIKAIGAANGRNPLPVVVPCHRVVGSDGSLTGFAGGLPAKQLLLRLEGAIH